MKTILLVLALALTVSFAGNAASVTSYVANNTEVIGASQTKVSTPAKKVKAKRPHTKKHHRASGAKRTPVVK